MLVEDWVEDLEGYSVDEIALALKYIRRELKFFPATAELIAYCERAAEDLASRHEPEQGLLPDIEDEVTDAVVEERMAKLEALKRHIGHAVDAKAQSEEALQAVKTSAGYIRASKAYAEALRQAAC